MIHYGYLLLPVQFPKSFPIVDVRHKKKCNMLAHHRFINHIIIPIKKKKETTITYSVDHLCNKLHQRPPELQIKYLYEHITEWDI
jgi:ribosomal protein S7